MKSVATMCRKRLAKGGDEEGVVLGLCRAGGVWGVGVQWGAWRRGLTGGGRWAVEACAYALDAANASPLIVVVAVALHKPHIVSATAPTHKHIYMCTYRYTRTVGQEVIDRRK